MDEILANVNNENFYSKKILKSEFDNFYNFINATKYPSHTDYLQYYPAPDLIKFMKASLTESNSQSKNKVKNKSYYNFLKAIGIEDLPCFSDSQLRFINTLSDYLPLVRPDTFIIISSIINNEECVFDNFKKLNPRINDQSLERAMNKLKRDNLIENSKLNVDVINEDFKTYVLDLLNYGLRRYEIDFGDFSSPNEFKLYANYYKEQVLDEFDCRQNQKGTHFIDENTICFITINPVKSIAHYKNKFLSQDAFQWESESNTSNNAQKNLRNTKKVYLFIRKTNYENKVTVPFTYFGTGHFESEKESFVTIDGKQQPTLLFKIALDEKINPKMCINFDVPYDNE